MSEIQETSVTPARSVGRTIARNTILGVATQFGLKIATFIFNVLVVRTLGGEEFGQYSIVLAWAGLFSVLGDLGVTQYLAREIARDPDKKDELFWDAVALRFLLAILSSVTTVVGAVLFTDYSPEIIIAIAVFTAGYFFQVIIAPYYSILTGSERVDIVSILMSVTQITFMVLAAIFLYMRLGFLWLFIAGLINLPLTIFLQMWAIRRYHLQPPHLKLNVRNWWGIILAGLPFGFIQLSLSFAFRVDTIILSRYVSDTQTGWYNVAYNLVFTILGISTSFNNAILPTLAREHVLNPETVKSWYYNSARVMIFISLPIAVGTTLVANDLVALLYQPEIAPAAIALAILIWDLPFVMYHSFCGNVVQSIKREVGAARVYGTLGVFNVLINLLFVPRFGIVGSSFATVLTDLLAAAQFYFLLRHEFGPGLQFNRLLRLACAAVAMGIMVYFVRGLSLFVAIPVGALTYMLFIRLFRVFSQEEQEMFGRAVRIFARMYEQILQKIAILMASFLKQLTRFFQHQPD